MERYEPFRYRFIRRVGRDQAPEVGGGFLHQMHVTCNIRLKIISSDKGPEFFFRDPSGSRDKGPAKEEKCRYRVPSSWWSCRLEFVPCSPTPQSPARVWTGRRWPGFPRAPKPPAAGKSSAWWRPITSQSSSGRRVTSVTEKRPLLKGSFQATCHIISYSCISTFAITLWKINVNNTLRRYPIFYGSNRVICIKRYFLNTKHYEQERLMRLNTIFEDGKCKIVRVKIKQFIATHSVSQSLQTMEKIILSSYFFQLT